MSRFSRRQVVFGLGVALLLVGIVFVNAGRSNDDPPEVDYSAFAAQVDADNVESVTVVEDRIEGVLRSPADLGSDEGEVTEFSTVRPAFSDDGIAETMLGNGVQVEAEEDAGPPLYETLLIVLLPVVILIIFFARFLKGGAGGGGGLMALGKSRETRFDGEGTVTFDDVAGIEEVKAELTEIVEFLKTPERFRRLGARVPRGVLLAGPPGTGKTLLAKALAGEADVPFFSAGGSSFNEMLVGVGASRVRELFAKARAEAPSIVFIDELDAVGGKRSANAAMGEKELQNTLNQVLIELDGFTDAESVIVIGATNQPEALDSALLRPGRFDRQLTVHPPDHAGRRAVLDVHTRSVPLADDADLDALASTTPGMVGADLQHLVNEAAIIAARRDAGAVGQADLLGALERVLLGAERNVVIDEDQRRRTAFHESGHALLAMLLPGADPVRKISIIPRGRALGVTVQSPDADRYGLDEQQLRTRLTTLLGGRAAERLAFDEVTTGAEDDLEQASRLARLMVGRWGMSDAVGPVSVFDTSGHQTVADSTLATVDAEVRRLVEHAQAEAEQLLEQRRSDLDALAMALLEHETLDQADAYALLSNIEREASFDS